MMRMSISSQIIGLAIFIIVLSGNYSIAETVESESLKLTDQPDGYLNDYNFEVTFAGKFVQRNTYPTARAISDNGMYRCEYDIGRVGDEIRELKNFKLHENDRLLYSLTTAPGSDLYISNAGVAAFVDHTQNYINEIRIHFYSNNGRLLFSEKYTGANLFGFSSSGNRFGVGTPKGFQVISIPDRRTETYDRCFQFDISEDDELVAAAMTDKIKVYGKDSSVREFQTGYYHTRKVRISSQEMILAAVDKKHLMVFSLVGGNLLFADSLSGDRSYRDLKIIDGEIFTGVQSRDNDFSKGILKVFDIHGAIICESEQSSRNVKPSSRPKPPESTIMDYDPVPWPFPPFDSVCTVWNYYEQHMGIWGDGWSYLHQGLDLITAVDEPTYAVETGIVKCVLTLGGNYYWRLAISPEQSPDTSTGWLYAHLVESSIAVDIGDTVEIYDYLADIVQWTPFWGHIHFVKIRDFGLVWHYEDDEWGITFNPLLALEPDLDIIPPVFGNVFDDSKFAFCLNETSTYLSPDSLYGDIDIIVQVKDWIGDAEYDLPAYETYYWLKNLPEGDTIVPRTLAQILNHPYDFYASERYDPYAPLIYKRDDILVPPPWESNTREFYHLLTNNDGDSTAILGEEDLAFETGNYPDGDYRICVEALDAYGNSACDSMNIRIWNDPTGAIESDSKRPEHFALVQNFPNPFNQTTSIQYNLPEASHVTLIIYDILGREVDRLIDENRPAGYHRVQWNADDLPSGVYYYMIQAGKFEAKMKMSLLK